MLINFRKVRIQSKTLLYRTIVLFSVFLLLPTAVSFAHNHERFADKGKTDSGEKVSESANKDKKFCPIINFPEATLTGVSVSEGGDSVSGKIELQNNSNYSFGSLKVALLVFDPENPDRLFWSVLPNDYQLFNNDNKNIDFSLSLSYLPAGDYVIDVYLSQGSDINLLGTVIKGLEYYVGVKNDGVEYDNIFFKKTSPATKKISTSFIVDGKKLETDTYNYKGGKDSVEIEVVSKNEKDTLRGLDMLNVITKGSIPLGEAVVGKQKDNFTLISGVTHSTPLSLYDEMTGDYTVWSAFVDDEEFQPLSSLNFKYESPYKEKLAYFPFVGVSTVPLTNSSEVVACVKYLENDNTSKKISDSIVSGFLEPMAADFELKEGDKNIAISTVSNLNSGFEDYLLFKPVVKDRDGLSFFTVSVKPYILTPKFSMSPYDSLDSFSKRPFVTSYTQTLSLVKADGNVGYSGIGLTKSPLYYIGIVLASLLILILMLRRLDTGPGFKSEVTEDELR